MLYLLFIFNKVRIVFVCSDQFKPQRLKSDPLYKNEFEYKSLKSLLLANSEPSFNDASAVDGLFEGFFLPLTTLVVVLSAVAIFVLWRYYCWRAKAKQGFIAFGKKKTVGGIKKSFTYMLKHNSRLHSAGGYNL